MTAIAYKAGIMAADTVEISANNMILGTVSKITRSPAGALGAASGLSPACYRFAEWFRLGGWEDDAPLFAERVEDGKFGALIVEPCGSVWRIDPSGRRYQAGRAPFYVEGACYQILTGAMAAGASAEEAVKIALQYDRDCGGEVQVERLGDAP